MIKLLVDSTCDLPEEFMQQYAITMVPLQVNIAGTEYLDKVTISVEEVYDFLRAGKFGKTSQPNPLTVQKLVKQELELGHDVVFITISSGLSGTYQTMKMVLDELNEDYPSSKIAVIDSKGGSGIPALMAIQAARMIEQGVSVDDIAQTLNQMAEHAEHIFTINDLKYLMRGGRVNKAEAVIGNILKIKPILHVVDGQIELFQKVRGMKKALNMIVDIVVDRIKEFPEQMIGIMHADDLTTANVLESMIHDKLPTVTIIKDKIGSTLGTHLGIGGVGVFFFKKKPDGYLMN